MLSLSAVVVVALSEVAVVVALSVVAVVVLSEVVVEVEVSEVEVVSLIHVKSRDMLFGTCN